MWQDALMSSWLIQEINGTNAFWDFCRLFDIRRLFLLWLPPKAQQLVLSSLLRCAELRFTFVEQQGWSLCPIHRSCLFYWVISRVCFCKKNVVFLQVQLWFAGVSIECCVNVIIVIKSRPTRPTLRRMEAQYCSLAVIFFFLFTWKKKILSPPPSKHSVPFALELATWPPYITSL